MSDEIGPSHEENNGDTEAPNGGSATDDELKNLVVGSKAESKDPANTVHTSETPSGQVPGKADTKSARDSDEGSSTEDEPKQEAPHDVPIPQDLQAGEEESTPQETTNQPGEQPPEQKSGLRQRVLRRVFGRPEESPTSTPPVPEQPTQKEILQGKIDERRAAFETSKDASLISLDNDQLQGVRYDPTKSNPFVVKGADGNNRYLSKQEFNKTVGADITREEKEAEQLSTEPQTQISDEAVAAKLDDFKSGAREHGTVRFEGQELTYQGFEGSEEQERYVFKDKSTGAELSLSEDRVTGIIRDELGMGSKAIENSEKFGAKVQEKLAQAGRGLKEQSERAASLVNTVRESKIGGFLYEQGNAFLNKFDPRDKEKIPYFAGMAVGAGSNVALTYFTPFLAFGPGRLVRSAAFSGVMLGVSKGANVFRHRAMNKVLSNFGVEDKAERAAYSKQYDETFKLLSKNSEEEYGEAMKKLSADIFAKHGNANSGSNVEAATTQETSEELQKRIESLSTRHQKLNNQIRSFSAGLSAGSITATLGTLGFENLFDKGGDGGGIAPGEGGEPTDTPSGGGVEPTPTPEPETPDGTGEPAPEPGPDPTPEPEPTPTDPSSLSEVLANPDFASSVEIQQGDTVGQLLTNSGYDIDWGTDNAEVFGAHIQANYDMLQGMNEQIAATGISVEDFPTQAEVSTLIEQANAGDAVAMHRLTETLHWIPAGGEFTILSPEAVELINNPQGG